MGELDTNLTSSAIHRASLLTNEIRAILEIFIAYVFTLTISMAGVVLNTACVAVYWRQGFKNSISVTLLSLSFSDLGLTLTTSLIVSSFIIEWKSPLDFIDMTAFNYVVLAYTRGCFFSMSTLFTVYLSAERCLCVVVPFKIKQLFTRSKSFGVCLGITLFSLACYCPAWFTQGLVWRFDPVRNISRLSVWVVPYRRSIDQFIDSYVGIVQPTIAQILVTLCSFSMVTALTASSKFKKGISRAPDESSHLETPLKVSRRLSNSSDETSNPDLKKPLNSNIGISTDAGETSNLNLKEKVNNGISTDADETSITNLKEKVNKDKSTTTNATSDPDIKIGNNTKINNHAESRASNSNSNKATSLGKEARITKMVQLVALIFCLRNLPVLIVSYVRPFVPEFDYGRRYNNLYVISYASLFLFNAINSTINFFVYFSCNSKFRASFKAVFCGNKSE